MEIVLIVIAVVMGIHVLSDAFFLTRSHIQSNKFFRLQEEALRDKQRHDRREVEVVDQGLARMQKNQVEAAAVIRNHNETIDDLRQNVTQIYALLKGASSGSIPPEAVVARIKATQVLPEDKLPSSEEDEIL